MSIRVEEEMITVWISDEHADDATPKSVKDAYLKKQLEVKKLIEMAEELGLEVVQQGTQTQPAPQTQPVSKQSPSQPASSEPSAEGRTVVSGKAADNFNVDLSNVKISGSGISAPGHQYTIKSEEKPSEDLREGEVAEMGMVKGVAGIEVPIAVKRSGKTGTTEVKIVDTGGDNALQKRFKQMAKSESTDSQHSYDVVDTQCPLCRGDGVVRKKECPKCGGSGTITIS